MTKSERIPPCHKLAMKRKAAAVSKSGPSAIEEMEDRVEDVHTKAAQMDEILSQVRENCIKFIATAKEEANNVVALKEAMKVELAEWEEEKKRIASTHNFKPKVKLDVGGDTFATTLATLTRFPETMLGAMFSGRHALMKDETGIYFIDRDGPLFREILKFLRSPESFDNSAFYDRQLTELKNEAEYYGLKDLMFPPQPPPLPFMPVQPKTVRTVDGYDVIITQDNDQLWYMQHKDFGDAPVVICVCNSCGFGWPNGQDYSYGVERFKKDRTVIAAQPREIGGCPNCGR